MPELDAKSKPVQGPFLFSTRMSLAELTGLRAATLPELVELIAKVPGASIYYHTHRFLQIHQYLSPEPPNDFAYWVGEALGENELSEKLASIDTVQFETITELREKIVEKIEKYLQKNPKAKDKSVNAGEEFYFIKSVSFVLPTNYLAHDLKEFVEILKKVSIDSIYFHIFEARLRLERKTNDFSFWIGTSLGEKEVAAEIARLDPYTHAMEDLRKTIINIVKKRL